MENWIRPEFFCLSIALKTFVEQTPLIFLQVAGGICGPFTAQGWEKRGAAYLKTPILAQVLVLPLRIELRTSPLPNK
jgi:hypothetical protein